MKGISGGEKRRLSLAVQLISDPAVLLADEPLSGEVGHPIIDFRELMRCFHYRFGRLHGSERYDDAQGDCDERSYGRRFGASASERRLGCKQFYFQHLVLS